MSEKVDFVDFKESLSIKVGRELISKGLDIASSTGIAENILSASSCVGILRKNPDRKPRKYFFGLFTQLTRRDFLGVIWLNNDTRGANEKEWVLEMYGRKNVEYVKQLADQLAKTFQVKISLKLVREQPDVETFLSDYDY